MRASREGGSLLRVPVRIVQQVIRVEAAIKRYDVHVDMKAATVQKVLARWQRIMRRSSRWSSRSWPSIRAGGLASNVDTEQQHVRRETGDDQEVELTSRAG